MTDTIKIDRERALFEVAAKRLFGQNAPLQYVRDALPKDDPRHGEYVLEALRCAWLGWQARAALSQAEQPVAGRMVPVELLERATYNLELAYGDMPTIRELRALLAADTAQQQAALKDGE